jgi:hypothetical protein
MKDTLITFLVTKKTVIILAALLVIGCYFVVTTIVEARLQSLEAQLVDTINAQKEVLVAIAQTTSRNSNDEATANIVTDCDVTERVRFDDLLGQLDRGLSKEELTELDRLFGRCGEFYSKQKAVMVFRLNREVEAFKTYVNQLQIITGRDVSQEYNVTGWEALASEEEKQSKLFSDLVALQDEIITTLLNGKAANSEEMKGVLREVQEIQETLVVANKQAAALRATVITQ